MRKAVPLLFVLPSLVLVGYFVYVALGWNVIASLSDWEGLIPSYNFIGFKNYADLFQDPVFWISLKNVTLLFLIFVPGALFAGLFLAILLDLKVRAESAFRTIYLLPFALSFVVTGTVWAWMYSPRVGVMNSMLRQAGLGFLEGRWITDPSVAMYYVILALIWQFAGYTMLIFLAGIRSVPESQIAAAKVSGASNFKLYRHIVIPQLKYPAFLAFTLLAVIAVKTFDLIFVMTGGGPAGYATHVLSLMMYKEAFGYTKFAYGAAIGNVLLILAMIIVIPYLYLTFRKPKE
ncbi:MAG: carbohydrate ABC transporter permease [Candidatus Geothermarchaeales archaeon]